MIQLPNKHNSGINAISNSREFAIANVCIYCKITEFFLLEITEMGYMNTDSVNYRILKHAYYRTCGTSLFWHRLYNFDEGIKEIAIYNETK